MISRHSHRTGGGNSMTVHEDQRTESAHSAESVTGLLRVAGGSIEALQYELGALRDTLASGADMPLGTVIGSGPYRLAWAAQSARTVTIPDARRYVRSKESTARVAFLFAGLGEEYPGMAAGLYRAHPEFRRTIDVADEILAPTHGPGVIRRFIAEARRQPLEPQRRILSRKPHSNDEDVSICVAHPIVFAIECALADLWRSFGCTPHVVLGYSLGEFAAAHAAGVFDFETGLSLIAERARLIEQHAPRGVMLAVPLSCVALAPHLSSETWIVGHNGPGLSIVGGSDEAMQALEQRLDAAGCVSQKVRSQFAFHTPMLAPVRQAMHALAQKVRPQAPQTLWVSTVSGRAFAPGEWPDEQYWCRHLCEPVAYMDGLQALLSAGARIFIEIGPGQSLCSAAALHPEVRSQDVLLIASLPARSDQRSDVERLLSAMGQAWCAGAPIGSVPVFSMAQPSRASPEKPSDPERHRALTAALAGMMGELLAREQVDPEQNVFDLGADSLLALRLARRITERLQRAVSLREIYEHPTLVELAAHLSSTAAAAPAPVRLPRRTRLPNGMQVWHSSGAELQQFYHDIFEESVYVRDGVELPADACVLDIGANIGLFSLYVAQQCSSARIFSVEPAPPLFEILRMNLRLHCPGAVAIQCGLADRPGSARFTFYPESSGLSSFAADIEDERDVLRAILRNQLAQGDARMSGLLDAEDQFLAARLRQQTYACELRTVSQLIAEHRIERVDLLKIDVQKLEHAVLLGIEVDDWSKIQQIAVEVHDIDGRLAAVQSLLRAKGYRVAAHQDALYKGTPHYNMIAVRAGIQEYAA